MSPEGVNKISQLASSSDIMDIVHWTTKEGCSWMTEAQQRRESKRKKEKERTKKEKAVGQQGRKEGRAARNFI